MALTNVMFILLHLFLIVLTCTEINSEINKDGATIDKFPYIVSVRYNDQHICGGAILDRRTVLTSAQCIFDMKQKPNLISVRVGSSEHKTGTLIKNSKVPLHPKDYEREYHENDIGIIKLDNDINFVKENIKPIRLPLKNYTVPDNVRASFVGWGVNGEKLTEVSDTLRYSPMKTLPFMECTEKYGMNMIHPSTMLCAQSETREFCKGDLGGPLVIDDKLVGITSWIYDCNESTYPGVYTNVVKFLEWIDDKLEK